MRPRDSRLRISISAIPATLLLSVIPVLYALGQSPANTPTRQSFQFPAQSDLQATHEGIPITNLGLSDAEIETLTMLMWDSGTIEPTLPSDYELRDELLARQFDFGGGEQNGFVLQATNKFCDSLGNCRTWFFRKIGGKWKPLHFEDEEDGTLASMFEAVPPKHNGLYELVLGSHFNAFEVPLAQLWFDGKKYVVHQTYCRYNETGKVLAGDCE